MRLSEIEARKPVAPLTPAQMRTATDKKAEANAKVQDARQEAAIKVAAAKRKAAAL